MATSRRRYSDRDKASALAAVDANDGNVRRTALELDIPVPTLQRWASGGGISDDVNQLRITKKDSLADALEDVAWAILSFMPEKLPHVSGKDLATMFGIAAEKIQLLRGQPTAIESVSSTVRQYDLNTLSPDEKERLKTLLIKSRMVLPAAKSDSKELPAPEAKTA